MKRKQVKARRPQCTRKVSKKEAFSKRFSLSVKPILWSALFVIPLLMAIGGYQWIQNPENLTIESVEVTGEFSILDTKQLQPLIES